MTAREQATETIATYLAEQWGFDPTEARQCARIIVVQLGDLLVMDALRTTAGHIVEGRYMWLACATPAEQLAFRAARTVAEARGMGAYEAGAGVWGIGDSGLSPRVTRALRSPPVAIAPKPGS